MRASHLRPSTPSGSGDKATLPPPEVGGIVVRLRAAALNTERWRKVSGEVRQRPSPHHALRKWLSKITCLIRGKGADAYRSGPPIRNRDIHRSAWRSDGRRREQRRDVAGRHDTQRIQERRP